MALRYTITHKTIINKTEVTYRVDIFDAEYSELQPPIERSATGSSFFDLQYDQQDEREVFARPVQGSSLAFQMVAETQADINWLIEILDAQQTRIRVAYYKDNVEIWQGLLNPDILEYEETALVLGIAVEIVAKDTSLMDNFYPLYEDEEQARIIQIMKECLDASGIILPIKSYTNITHVSEFINQAQDFLWEMYHDRFHFRDYSGDQRSIRTRSPGGDITQGDKAMSFKTVLENICYRYNLIIRQSKGYWYIEQLPAIAKGDAVEYTYANTENPPSINTEWIRIYDVDNDQAFITTRSRNRISGPLKRIESKYNHKTILTTFNRIRQPVPIFGPGDFQKTNIRLDGDAQFKVYVRGEAIVTLNEVYNDPIFGSAFVFLRAKSSNVMQDDYYWNSANSSWVQPSGASFEDGSFPWANIPPLAFAISAASGAIVTGTIDTVTEPMPADIEEIEIIRAYVQLFTGITQIPDVDIDRVTYENFEVKFLSENQFQNSTALAYEYLREGDHSVSEKIPDTIIGQGPNVFSRGAVRAFVTEAGRQFFRILENGFVIRGQTDELQLERLMLRERISTRRGSTRVLLADIYGAYVPDELLNYDGQTWYFLGGNFRASDCSWTANIVRLNHAYQSGDTFDTITSADPSTGSNAVVNSTYGSGPGTGGEPAVGLEPLSITFETENFRSPAGHQHELEIFIDDALEIDGNTLKVKDHGEAQRGAITAGSQTIYGQKTFNSDPILGTGTLRSTGTFASVRDATGLGLKRLKVGAPAATDEAVQAGRTLTMQASADGVLTYNLTGAQNLTANRSWLPSLRTATQSLSGILSAGAQNIGGNKTFYNEIRMRDSSLFQSDAGFVSGFSGSGFRLSQVGSEWRMTLDSLLIRGSLQAYEFIIDQISAVNGSDILSPGRGKIESNPSSNVYVVSDPAGGNFSSFAENDIVLVQQVTPNPSEANGYAIVKRIVRRVVSTSGNSITLGELLGAPADVGTIQTGDVIVTIGNTTNADRQGSIFRTAADADSPYVRINQGVQSWPDWTGTAKTVLQYGNLNGLDFGFGSLSGFGVAVRDRFYAVLGDSDTMVMGRNAGGAGKHGLQINQGNYWYGTGDFRIGANTASFTKGIDYNPATDRLRIFTDTFLVDDTVSFSAADLIIDSSTLNGQNGITPVTTPLTRTYNPGATGIILKNVVWALGGTLPEFPATTEYTLQIEIEYQGRLTGTSTWETFEFDRVSSGQRTYEDPCQGSEQDPCLEFFTTNINRFVRTSPKYDGYRIRVSPDTADTVDISLWNLSQLGEKTAIGDNGILAVRNKSILGSRLFSSETEFVDIEARRVSTAAGGFQLVAVFIADGEVIAEKVITTDS